MKTCAHVLIAAVLAAGCGKTENAAPAKASAPADVLIVPASVRGGMDIAVTPVEAGEIRRTITVPASVIADPATSAVVSTLVSARVAQVQAAQGARVAKGQTLAVLESMELGAMAAEHIRAQSEAAMTKHEYERVKGLFDGQVSSEKQLQSAQNAMVSAQAAAGAARTKLLAAGMSEDDIAALLKGAAPVLHLRAPIAGVVSMRNASIGQNAGTGDRLFEILATGTATVEGSVFEDDFASLRTGQKARFTVHPYPDAEFAGELAMIGAVIDERTHALPVRCRVANPRGELRPNQHGRLAISTEVPVRVLSVPADAIVFDGSDRFVFVRTNDSTFSYRKVETGAEFDDRIEIRHGVKEGEPVVSRGVFQLKSQLKLAGAAEE